MQVLDALAPAELSLFGQQLCKGLVEEEASTELSDVSAGGRAPQDEWRALFAALVLEMPTELVAETNTLDLAKLTALPMALPAPRAAAPRADDDDGGVTQVGVQSRVAIAATPTQARFRVVDDRGPDAAAYFGPEELERLRKVRRVIPRERRPATTRLVHSACVRATPLPGATPLCGRQRATTLLAATRPREWRAAQAQPQDARGAAIHRWHRPFQEQRPDTVHRRLQRRPTQADRRWARVDFGEGSHDARC